jgi:hypothetical protein
MGGCGAGFADVIVALNRSDQERDVEIPAGTYVDLLLGGTSEGGAVTLGARSYAVLRAE